MPAPFPTVRNCVLVPTKRFATLERRGRCVECVWDALTPDWAIAQLKEGHRFSNDDAFCGFFAAESAPHARRLLDLGSGVGSVGLITLWRSSPEATLTCVEAQSLSHDLCRRTIARNELDDRVELILEDLRQFDGNHGYDLITGSPPYFAPEDGVASPHDQRAFCRLEFRGGLDDYCACASRALSNGGTFAFVMAAQDPRCESAPAQHGFGILRRVDVVFKAGRRPHICVCVCARLGDARLSHPRTETLVLRDGEGKRTRAYRIWQERSRLPSIVAAEAVEAVLDDLVRARDRAALVDAVAAAEAVGLRADPGSEELVSAKARLVELGGV
jgi:tRNA1(Val) A37 N6-methylase TrmN6